MDAGVEEGKTPDTGPKKEVTYLYRDRDGMCHAKHVRNQVESGLLPLFTFYITSYLPGVSSPDFPRRRQCLRYPLSSMIQIKRFSAS